MAHQEENVVTGMGACAAIVPRVNISMNDKAMLIEDLHLAQQVAPNEANKKKKGQLTWLMAAIALPTVGILLLLTLFLLAEPLEQRPHQREAAKLTRTLRNNIFIIDINEPEFPTAGKTSQLKTILKANQNNELYQITLNQMKEQRRNTTAFEKLKKRFKNFHYMYQNAGSFFKGSIFENEPSSPRDMLFKAQLLILWRYGGTVLAPQWLTLKPIDAIPKNDQNLIVGGYNGHFGFMSVSNTCNAKIYDIMLEMKKANLTSLTEMEIIDRAMLKSKKGINKLSFPQVCSQQTLNDRCVYMRGFKTDFPVLVVNNTNNVAQENQNYVWQFCRVIPSYFNRILLFSP